MGYIEQIIVSLTTYLLTNIKKYTILYLDIQVQFKNKIYMYVVFIILK